MKQKGLCVILMLILYTSPTFPDPIRHKGRGLDLHKEMYVIPASWSSKYEGDKTEVVFQLSVKQQILKTDFYFAYTQKSFWQAYNTDESSPFRETNYNPEIFYRIDPGKPYSWGLWDKHFLKHLGFDIGFEHESNGQSVPASRSWNRLYFIPFYNNDSLLLQLKLSYRIPEDEKENPLDTVGDDNSDICDYYGYGELNIYQQFYRNHLVHLMLRGSASTNKGAIEFTYSMPGFYGNIFYMLKAFHGYGDSLIDYNDSLTRIGIGIMLSR